MTEDEGAPAVSVANGAIDTKDPVVSVDQQKKYLKKVKTFEEFVLEAKVRLMESPANTEFDSDSAKAHMKFLIDTFPTIKVGDNHITKVSNTKEIHHSIVNGQIHNASMFDLHGTHVVHKVAHKMDASDADGIYTNIQRMVDSGHVVHSDSEHSGGGRSLWSNMHTKIHGGNFFVLQNGNKTPVNNFQHHVKIFDHNIIYRIEPTK